MITFYAERSGEPVPVEPRPLPGAVFARQAPRHDVVERGVDSGGRFTAHCRRCDRCLTFADLGHARIATDGRLYAMLGHALGKFQRGRCGVPEIGGHWRVGERDGFVTLINFAQGFFRLRTRDGIETEHEIGTPDDTGRP